MLGPGHPAQPEVTSGMSAGRSRGSCPRTGPDTLPWPAPGREGGDSRERWPEFASAVRWLCSWRQARRDRVGPSRKGHDMTASGQLDEINETVICHDEQGIGEPLVLVHGAWRDHTTWELVVPRLAEHLRVVAYDLRGHGRSTIDPPDAGTVHDDIADLVALIEHLGVAPVNVAGFSSGACIALRLAAEHPHLVRRVLAHEPPLLHLLADDPEAKPMLDELGEIMEDVTERLEAGDYRQAAQHFFDAMVGRPWSDLPSDERDRIVEHADAFKGQLRDPDAIANAPDALSQLSMPVLLTEGSESPAYLRRIADLLGELLANGRRHVIAGAGHGPHATHPDAYADAVLDFIRST